MRTLQACACKHIGIGDNKYLHSLAGHITHPLHGPCFRWSRICSYAHVRGFTVLSAVHSLLCRRLYAAWQKHNMAKSPGHEQKENAEHPQEDHTSGFCSLCAKEELRDLVILGEPQTACISHPCMFILCIQAPSQGHLYHSHSAMWVTVHGTKEFLAWTIRQDKPNHMKKAQRGRSYFLSVIWEIIGMASLKPNCARLWYCCGFSSWAVLTKWKPKLSSCSKFSAHRWFYSIAHLDCLLL